MVMCTPHTYRWPNLTKCKLLIIQTACQSPGQALAGVQSCIWQRIDAAATGTSDWSKKNWTCTMFICSHHHPPPASAASASQGYSSHFLYCISWNNEQCHWLIEECRYCHECSLCNGDHPRVSCPFHTQCLAESPRVGAHSKVLYGKAPPRGPNPHPFIYHF